MAENAIDFLARVEARAKEFYAISNQGRWEDLGEFEKRAWINAAGEELREEK